MTLQELLSHPGRKVCHLCTLIDRYQVLATIALIVAGVVFGVILGLVIDRAQRSGIEELHAAKMGREHYGG